MGSRLTDKHAIRILVLKAPGVVGKIVRSSCSVNVCVALRVDCYSESLIAVVPPKKVEYESTGSITRGLPESAPRTLNLISLPLITYEPFTSLRLPYQ